jgi:YfdX protein
VSTSMMPLATYPEAIRKAVPLIDAGKIDKAKMQIQSALNLLVVEETIYPLPALRVKEMLSAAEPLAEKPDRSDDESAQLANLLDAARHEVNFGKALGYYDKDVAKPILKEIEQIEAKSAKGRDTGENSFDKIKKMLGGIS